ncbi:MAG: hypothetical protein J7501_08535 [Bdellovibrio sp.]|nr:hypothetical protein [Bdellovibrio sp.]
MFARRILVTLCLLIPTLSHSQSFADYLYENTFYNLGNSYLDRVGDLPTDNVDRLPADQKSACLQRYGRMLNDGVLDIRIALGYFDWTVGHDVRAGGRNYGLSPSMDIGAFYAIRDLLTSGCSGNSRFCRFRQEQGNPYAFVKDVTIQGRPVRARIQMYFSSASEYLENNLGNLNYQQTARTDFMESFWARALQDADAAFYFGHSRNGGGPDFGPPVFYKGRNKVNYGYYESAQPGFKRMLNSLNSGKQADVIGLMSCASRDHFWGRLRSAAPRSGVITSTSVINVDEVYTAMLGGIDSLLRGQCQKTFYKSLRMTSRNAKYITMDGMFE